MAEPKKDDEFERLPIDVLPNFDLPEIIPLKREEVDKFLKCHAKVLRVLETWARIHLRALVAHPMSPTEVVDNLIDEIGEEDMKNTANKVLVDFNDPHLHEIEKPIGYNEEDPYLDVDIDRDDIDELSLLEPLRKKKRGSFFKRFLKWRPHKEKKLLLFKAKDAKAIEEPDDAEILRLREAKYEELRKSFHLLIEEKVANYKLDRDSRKVESGQELLKPEDLASEDAKWILDMTNRLQICHMAFKILGFVRERCAEIFTISSFSNLGPGATFVGDVSKLMQNRLNYLMTTKVLALMLASDIEKMQDISETYSVCREGFLRNVGGHRQLSKMDSVEIKVVEIMEKNDSILKEVESPNEIEENMKKSESQRDLLKSENFNIELGDYHIFDSNLPSPKAESSNRQSGSSAGISDPSVSALMPVSSPIINDNLNKGFQLKVADNGQAPEVSSNANKDMCVQKASTSGYSSASLLSQSPANALQEGSSPRDERPSFLNLPDPLMGRSRPKPTSREGSTSPMQESKGESPENPPMDQD